MGGASEDDEAMKWFLGQANGGDILVLRASGSDGYNDYMYSDLGVNVNSVETIVCHNAGSADETYIQDKISKAEAIWFAGGDQYDYVSYWKDTPVDSLINVALNNRKIVIGGTSAGMAIMGGYVYTGKNGSVTSAAALGNPYNSRVTIDSAHFLETKFLEDVITDTHYDNPDRRGRHVTFLARILKDYGIRSKGIACDEGTAVCIGQDGIAHIYGEFPSSNDNAYFLQTNCALSDVTPEKVQSNLPLDWNKNNKALWVYKIKGTKAGINTFDLNDWVTGNGGAWEDWYVENGIFKNKASTQTDCTPLALEEIKVNNSFIFYPNPVKDDLMIRSDNSLISSLKVFDIQGKEILNFSNVNSLKINLDLNNLNAGTYFVNVISSDRLINTRIVKL